MVVEAETQSCQKLPPQVRNPQLGGRSKIQNFFLRVMNLCPTSGTPTLRSHAGERSLHTHTQ